MRLVNVPGQCAKAMFQGNVPRECSCGGGGGGVTGLRVSLSSVPVWCEVLLRGVGV